MISRLGAGGSSGANFPVGPVTNFYAVAGNAQVELSWTNPGDEYIGNQILVAEFGRVDLWCNEDHVPERPGDGYLVARDAQSPYIHAGVANGVELFYQAFTYTTKGVVNPDAGPGASATPRTYEYFYGYDIDLADSNPATRVTYPSDVQNALFVPAKMVFGGDFAPGGWDITPGANFMPRPCMLNYDGTVAYYLDPSDYTKKEDGTTSDVANTAFGGNAMIEWPKIFTKRWEENGVYHFRCCDIRFDDDYECWCNYDRNNNEIDHFYTPIFFGSVVSGRLRSISGQVNAVSLTAQQEIDYAKANGTEWYTEVLADRLLIQDLLVLVAKTTEGQTAYGRGCCSASAGLAPGANSMNTKGMFWGASDRLSGVKIFGMENWWGNLYRRTAGWVNDRGTQKIKLTRGDKFTPSAADYNISGADYLVISGASPSGGTVNSGSLMNGYIDRMKAEAYGRLPVTADGSSTTYESDTMYYNNNNLAYAMCGGPYTAGDACGPFLAEIASVATRTDVRIGTALSCKPSAS